MSINRICTVCKRTFQLTTLTCSNCRANLTKFKVRVKRSGHWNTLQTESLDEAQQFQGKFTERETIGEALQHQLSFQGPLRGVDSRTDSSDLSEYQIPGTSPGPILREVFNSFMAWAETHKRSWRSDQQLFELRLSPLGSLPLSRITPEMIQTLIDNMIPQRKGKAKQRQRLAPATKLQAAALVRRLFNWAKKRRMWVGENPVSFIELEKVDNARNRYLTRTELQSLLKAIEDDHHEIAKLALRFLLLTGRRRGEVLALEWSDIDIERAMVRFRQTKNGRMQTVPVNSPALEVLTQAKGLQTDERVFPFKSSHSFSKVWNKIRRRAGLNDFRCHDLRHAFASIAASSGKVDIFTLCRTPQ